MYPQCHRNMHPTLLKHRNMLPVETNHTRNKKEIKTTDTLKTSAADDEEDPRETSKPNSETEGHEADMVPSVEEVPKTDTVLH